MPHLLSAALLAALSAPAITAGTLPEPDTTAPPATPKRERVVPSVTVTSTRATDRSSPAVYSELTTADLRRQHTVNDLPKLLADLPSTTFYSENGNGIGYSNLTIRGFDQRRIAVLVNGIPQNDPEDHNVYWINMPDLGANLDNVQVQRGAGLVNYGAAAIGGSVALTTSNFASERRVRLSAGLGWQEGIAADRNTFNPFDRSVQPAVARTSVEVSSGLIDRYAIYGRLSRIASQGYRDHSFAELTSWFFSAARFDDNVTTQINIFGGPIHDGLAYTGLPKAWANDPTLRTRNLSYFSYDSTGRSLDYAAERRAQEVESFSQPHYEILNDWYVSENVTVKSSLFYYMGDGYFDYDGGVDASAFGIDPATAPGFGRPIVRANVDNRHGGWIPRVTWKNGSGILTAGAEIRFHRSEHWGKLRYADGLPADYDPDYKFYQYQGERDILSAFARQAWSLTDDITVNTELQVVSHRYGLTDEQRFGAFTQYASVDGTTVGNGGDLFNVRYTFVNPRLGANWNIDARQNLLASVALTSREPRRNNLYDASSAFYGETPRFVVDTSGGAIRYDFTRPLVRPERMLDIELQYTWQNETVRASVGGYFMDFTDELVKNGRRDNFGIPIEGNAPRTRHAGIELQASAALWSSEAAGTMVVWGNATISSNRIVDYAYNISSNGVDTTVDLSGNAIAGFPDLLANIGLRYLWNDLRLDLTGKHIGAFRTDNFGDDLQTSTTLARGAGYVDNQIDPVFVVNALLAWSVPDAGPFPAIRLRLQVNNLLNTLYIAGGNGREFFPAAERNFYMGLDLDL